ncbi:MAG: hypothetical protein ACYDHD_06840 [Vulcanimicrobiaceae bacterium]
MATMIDTLALAQKLRQAEGAPEAIAEAIGHAVNEHAVTKNDLLLLEHQVDTKITSLEERLDAKLSRALYSQSAFLTGVIAVATAFLAVILHR